MLHVESVVHRGSSRYQGGDGGNGLRRVRCQWDVGGGCGGSMLDEPGRAVGCGCVVDRVAAQLGHL